MKLISRERDPFNGIVTEYYAQMDGNIYIRKLQDVSSILEENKRQQNSFSDWKSGRFNSAVKIGSIPPHLAEQWAKEWGVQLFSREFNQLVKKRLNERDYKYLKTVPGKV